MGCLTVKELLWTCGSKKDQMFNVFMDFHYRSNSYQIETLRCAVLMILQMQGFTKPVAATLNVFIEVRWIFLTYVHRYLFTCKCLTPMKSTGMGFHDYCNQRYCNCTYLFHDNTHFIWSTTSLYTYYIHVETQIIPSFPQMTYYCTYYYNCGFD